MKDTIKQEVLKNLTILYVEDEEFIREKIGELLKRKASVVYTANDGLEALEVYERYKPAITIVIADVTMPNMSGLEMSGLIRKNDPDTPIIITTAHHEGTLISRLVDVSIDQFVFKPVDVEQLFYSIDRCVDTIVSRLQIQRQSVLLQEYKKAVDVSSIVSKADKNGAINYVNDEFCRISGFEREELLGRQHSEVRHPNTPKEIFENMWETILQKQVWKGILENRTKSGESYFVDTCIVPISDDNGEIVEFIGIQKDLTQLILQERELENMRLKQMRDSVEKAVSLQLDDLVQSVPLACIIIDSGDNVTHANKLFIDLTQNETFFTDNKLSLGDIFDKCELGDEFCGDSCDWKEFLGVIYEKISRKININMADGTKLPCIVSIKALSEHKGSFLACFCTCLSMSGDVI